MSRFDDSYSERYDAYEEAFDPMQHDRKARRARKPKVKHNPKKAPTEIVRDLADPVGLEDGFKTSYRPGLFEQGWLLQSLRPFYDQDLITDVLARIRGGKEASVYRCAARPTTGADILAAKVYRPREFRNLRNDAAYREGRGILSAEGQDLNQSVHTDRMRRALGKKTAYGRQVAHTSWLMHEFTTLQKLYAAGAAVPRPIAASENAILMGFVGDGQTAAPALQEVALEADEAAALFDEAMRNIELLLREGFIHGDLSAYNILYWQGKITLIDFPQVVNCQANGSARTILNRDITRLCAYFADQGVERDPQAITNRLWKRHVAPAPEIQAADLSRLFPEEA